MTEQELQALVVILQRAPMTPAELLWINALMDRLRQTPQAEKSADTQQ